MTTQTLENNSFHRMIEIFNKKFEYLELVHEGGFSLPHKNRERLDRTIAKWTVDNINNFNSKNENTSKLIEICNEYLALTDKEADHIKVLL